MHIIPRSGLEDHMSMHISDIVFVILLWLMMQEQRDLQGAHDPWHEFAL